MQSREQAIELACTDADQYNVKSIMAYLGNPFKPRTMRFEIELENGEVGLTFLKEQYYLFLKTIVAILNQN